MAGTVGAGRGAAQSWAQVVEKEGAGDPQEGGGCSFLLRARATPVVSCVTL